MKLPKVSIVVLSFNGEKYLKRCLLSVEKQIYPKNKLELIVVDNGSSDKSVKLAKKYTNRVYVIKNIDGGYSNRASGMRLATGDFVYMILEQDMELRSKYFLQKLVRPLIEDPRIVASFTREYPNNKQPWINRFVSSNPSQSAPLFEYLTPSVSSTIIERRVNYSICKYIPGKIPTTTHMLFRVSTLKKTSIWRQKRDFDHDTIIKLVKARYQKFAYVPDAGIYHYHVNSLKELIDKSLRNLENHYFPYNHSLSYRWTDFSSKREVIKLVVWVIYANLFFPALVRGIVRFLKYHDYILLAEPVVVIVTTDAILIKFLTNKVGRKLAIQALKTIIKGR
ncbi:MAG: hypothetical protein US75_C0002G0021 [Candidatus Woesebacteria bacterium GW2011_GWC1_38_13]|uniref:Glycosyltransferase 2-like domain-containing protein n=3 Tax=Candidatus Woeseibacteriota TaxID=1752722 RepID=A0A0G0KWW4_9BACT|nr:MAG: hypothetical protein US67_C0049G0003 [Candidatus Woesebacteria bacterium GW2011_GWD1_38_10]KKQ56823.1 MAG: hypothetical protein US75_C0002G0021 [Candidatus Woesebacteria bacterium GW2011_GWC1_38_13]KKQ84163.1 MAG: hypothetical protein UT06_C0009G0020 [Candidatus Woesebacteria bacterium GW2011_GWA1_38_8]